MSNFNIAPKSGVYNPNGGVNSNDNSSSGLTKSANEFKSYGGQTSQTPPPVQQAPQQQGAYQAPPQQGAYQAPPQQGAYQAPPQQGAYQAPQQGAYQGQQQAPPSGGGFIPKSVESKKQGSY